MNKAFCHLTKTQHGLSLVFDNTLKLNDFCINLNQVLREKPLHFSDPLAKAIKPHQNVLDLTAGFGTDAIRLASWGCHIHMIEQNPIIFALLEDALNRFQPTGEHIFHIKLDHMNGIDYLNHLKKENHPDVIYLDPMFDSKLGKALPPKNAQILRMIVDEANQGPELLTLALTKAHSRVVVKRPKHAPPLADLVPSHHHSGKSHRFDVYLT